MIGLHSADSLPAARPPLVVTVHQPGYHRHLYYYAKMTAADVFVSLDTVQYVTREWQNRQVFWYDGARRWLTLPVRRGREPLRDKVITDPDALRRHWRVLRQAYASSPYFSRYEDELGALYAAPWSRLADLCAALDDVATRALGITTARFLASELLDGGQATRGRLLAELVLAVRRRLAPLAPSAAYLACATPMRADHYLRAGPGTGRPTQLEEMHAMGVSVLTFAYHPPRYRQYQTPDGHPFEAELSVFDLLFNHGSAARSILTAASDEPEQDGQGPPASHVPR